MPYMDLSIIIINYNTYNLTCQCIDSIIKETKNLTYEIIIVDNASKECSPTKFIEKYPKIRLINNKLNVGFGIANNQGMEIAMGDFFLLLNSDTIILKNAIGKTLNFIKNHHSPKIGIVGCQQENGDGEKLQVKFNSSYNIFRYIINRNLILDKLNIKLYPPRNKIGALSGAFMMFKKQIYLETKGFDPDFFLYSEEIEWCRNRVAKDFELMFFEDAKIIHLVGKSGTKKIMLKQQFISFALAWYKTGKFSYFLFIANIFITNIFRLLYIPFLSKVKRQKEFETFKEFLELSYYYFIEIPKYNNNYGARPAPLKLKELQS